MYSTDLGNLTQETFGALLEWLDPDREMAGQKYELIHNGLIRVFLSKGFTDAEYLADKAINIVTERLKEIRDSYVGDQARYFHGVARNLIREEYRRKEIATDELPVILREIKESSDEYDCLVRCLELLPQAKRELILDYHQYEGHDKVEIHKKMAEELAITENALRGRAHQIRATLEKCVRECAMSIRTKTKSSLNAL
jgi:DNA-directed RNA polymerase specialized sigma24 family protein